MTPEEIKDLQATIQVDMPNVETRTNAFGDVVVDTGKRSYLLSSPEEWPAVRTEIQTGGIRHAASLREYLEAQGRANRIFWPDGRVEYPRDSLRRVSPDLLDQPVTYKGQLEHSVYETDGSLLFRCRADSLRFAQALRD